MISQLDILKLARKKKRITIRDFKYWDLETMVHTGLLDKIYSKSKTGRGDGWPSYKLSRRGLRSLTRSLQVLDK